MIILRRMVQAQTPTVQYESDETGTTAPSDTDTTPPAVISTSPKNEAIDMAIDSALLLR